jgi:hypothetical protein
MITISLWNSYFYTFRSYKIKCSITLTPQPQLDNSSEAPGHASKAQFRVFTVALAVFATEKGGQVKLIFGIIGYSVYVGFAVVGR